MKRLGMVVLVLILCIVGLGFYRGWFALSSTSGGADSNKVNINLTLDPDKAKEDAEKLKNKSQELPGRVTKGAKRAGDPARDRVKADHD